MAESRRPGLPVVMNLEVIGDSARAYSIGACALHMLSWRSGRPGIGEAKDGASDVATLSASCSADRKDYDHR